MVATTKLVLSGLVTSALAIAEPAVTAAAELQPRQYAVNPVLVGYISASDGCTSSALSTQTPFIYFHSFHSLTPLGYITRRQPPLLRLPPNPLHVRLFRTMLSGIRRLSFLHSLLV